MNRRDFLWRTGASVAGLTMADPAGLFAQAEPPPWRAFEITTRVRVLQPRGMTRVWLPMPLAVAPYQTTMGDNYHPGDGTAVMIETNANEPDMLGCAWEDGIEPVVTVVNRVAARTTYAVDLTSGAGADVGRARALFDATDDNALFVERCRAAGLPARNVYGLALSSGDATRAQQSRAEVQFAGLGWAPVDARARLFGSWDMHWVAYNFGRDVSLRGSARPPLGSFMYPQGETAAGPIDSLDAERFRYAISVQEAAALLA